MNDFLLILIIYLTLLFLWVVLDRSKVMQKIRNQKINMQTEIFFTNEIKKIWARKKTSDKRISGYVIKQIQKICGKNNIYSIQFLINENCTRGQIITRVKDKKSEKWLWIKTKKNDLQRKINETDEEILLRILHEMFFFNFQSSFTFLDIDKIKDKRLFLKWSDYSFSNDEYNRRVENNEIKPEKFKT